MTLTKATALRFNTIGISPYTESPLSNQIYCDKNDVSNVGKCKELKVMDVGFIIPKDGFNRDLFEAYYEKNPIEILMDNAENTNSKSIIQESMCINSTTTKWNKNIISKKNFQFEPREISIYGKIDPESMYIWRYGIFKFKGDKYDEGYELSILNDKLQIENRAYYIKIERD